jgi:hypothetical protein
MAVAILSNRNTDKSPRTERIQPRIFTDETRIRESPIREWMAPHGLLKSVSIRVNPWLSSFCFQLLFVPIHAIRGQFLLGYGYAAL